MAEKVVIKDWRITIPAEVWRRLGLKPGDSLSVQFEDGRIVLAPVRLESTASSKKEGRAVTKQPPPKQHPD